MYLGDYGWFTHIVYGQLLKFFFLAGAWSIDAAKRTDGVDWWHDEELSMADLSKAQEIYEDVKPDVVISHECPQVAGQYMIDGVIGRLGTPRTYNKSRTSTFLQALWEFHQPKKWYFGHHHMNKAFKIGETSFRCVDILTAMRVEL
jgi:hypothetical protein